MMERKGRGYRQRLCLCDWLSLPSVFCHAPPTPRTGSEGEGEGQWWPRFWVFVSGFPAVLAGLGPRVAMATARGGSALGCQAWSRRPSRLPGGPARWERPSSPERASRGTAAGPLLWRPSERFVLPGSRRPGAAFPGAHGRGCWSPAARLRTRRGRRLRCPGMRGVGCVWRGCSETGGLKGGEPPWGFTAAVAVRGSVGLVRSLENGGVVVPHWAFLGQTSVV